MTLQEQGSVGYEEKRGLDRHERCYYCKKKGNKFETNDETEYQKHGTKKHFQRPLYPNKTDIEVYGLTHQGREREV
jgi:hypothetical protein